MKLTTTYLGFKLRTPLVPSALPLSENIDNIKRMEDAGALRDRVSFTLRRAASARSSRPAGLPEQGTESFAEALTYFPEHADFKVGPEAYLSTSRRRKQPSHSDHRSLNGATFGGWTELCAPDRSKPARMLSS